MNDTTRGGAHAARYESLLFITAAIWGSGFVAQRLGLQNLGPFGFNTLRFAVGTLVLIPILLARRVRLSSIALPGLIAGLVLFVGSSLQQIGMQYTSAGKGGFITGLYVVMVPIAGMFMGRHTPARAWLGVLLAVAGMFLLTINQDLRMERGDLWVLAGAIFWTAHILVMDRFSPKVDPFALAAAQFAVCSLASAPMAFLTETMSLAAVRASALPVLWSGVLTIGLGFTLQAVAQTKAHPTRASIIMSLEAAFAVLGGWLVLRERLSARELIGCAVMLGGMVVAQLPEPKAKSASGQRSGTPIQLRKTPTGDGAYRVSLPLLHDHHSHTGLYAALDSCPSILGLSSAEAQAFLMGLDRNRLSMVTGWRTDAFAPDRRLLDTLPPVLLINFSLHGYALSAAALPFLRELAPELAEHAEDEAWREAHVPELFEAYANQAGLAPDALDAQFSKLQELGIGSTEDMAVPSARALDSMIASPYRDRLAFWAAPGLYSRLDERQKNAVRGIKLFLDGSLGARTAALSGGWLGEWKAIMAHTDQELDAVLSEASGLGKALSVHAIGERAIEQAIAAIGRCLRSGGRFSSIRLEHAQFISLRQAKKARELGIILSMQPNFTSDSVDYADRLEPKLLAANNPFRMLIDECGYRPGTDLVFGSDGMPHGIEYAARQSLFPAFPGQRLSLEELVAGYGSANGVANGFANGVANGFASAAFTLEVDEARRSVRRIR